MRVLSIDTALDACQAALTDGGAVLAVRSEPMAKGHQERLAPMVQAMMADARAGFCDLDRIGVTVGPGSFTGLRVGLAFAKGLSLALRIPCLGVGTLNALAASAPVGLSAASIDARRERVYWQVFDAGVSTGAPELLDLAQAQGRARDLAQAGPLHLVGPGATLLAAGEGAAAVGVPDPVALALLTAQASEPIARPEPLYLRPPDARTLAERTAALALR